MAEAESFDSGHAAMIEAFVGEVITSQVSGGVWSILAQEGAHVKAGDPLLIVESMKMEISMNAPCDGTIRKVLCAEGQPVSAGQALVLLS
jgi:urea carboxylase